MVVTGGTGALGRAVVAAFLEAGDRVVVPWIVKEERDEVSRLWAQEVEAERVEFVETDVAEETGAAVVARTAGAVSVLVNGVGGFEGGTPLAETDLAAFDRMYRINLRSAVAMSRAVVPAMRAGGGGAIINVAAAAAIDPPPGLAAYSAAKAAVAALTRTLHAELAADGVRVNAVVPTTIDTPANRAAMPDADFSAWTPPAKIARVILWLAGDEASSVRGGLIPV